METEETIYDEDLRYEDEETSRKVDARIFQEPIRALHLRAGRVAVPLGATIGEAAQIMKEHRIGCFGGS